MIVVMTADANKALMRRFFEEVFNQQSRAAAEALIAPEFVAHHPAFPDGIRGPEGTLQIVAMFHSAFPDLHYSIEALASEGELVAVRWQATGTHRGEFRGTPDGRPIPPTGRPVAITGIDLFRVDDRRCLEAWVQSDFLGLLLQIGALP
jgi:steroid delta-isomerase-like uncharacterized protein